jgi:RNA polymerase sigma-70 factor, ECF subfamily
LFPFPGLAHAHIPRRARRNGCACQQLHQRLPMVQWVVLLGCSSPILGPTYAPMTNSGTDLCRLIDRARREEPGALDRLLDSYRNYLRLLARTGIDVSLQGKADASDLVQDALLRASQHFGQFRGACEAELTSWLRQILARCLADFIRRYRAGARRAGREQSLDELLNHSSQAMERIVSANGTSPSASAERRDLGVVLSNALAELSDDHRDVIVLHHLEGLGWDEVGRRLGRTSGAVRMLWARALKELRPLIDERL